MNAIIELLRAELKNRKNSRDKTKDINEEDFKYFDAQVRILEHLLIQIKIIQVT